MTTEFSINPFREPGDRPVGDLLERAGRATLVPKPPPTAPALSVPVRRRRIVAGAGGALLVLCTAAVVVEVPRYEQRVQRRTATQLGSAGFDGLVVVASGSDVRISGLRSEQDAAAAAAIADAVPGVGEVVVVTPADAAGVPYTDPDLPVLTATLQAGRLSLRGQLPDRAFKDTVIDIAERTVGRDRLVDEVRAVDGEPTRSAQGDIEHVAALLARLPEDLVAGSVQLDGRTLTVAGLPRASADRAPIDRLLRAAAADGLTVIDRRQR